MAGPFAAVTIESGRGCTCITPSVRDDSELYGLIHRLEDLAMHLISLGELGAAETADTLGSPFGQARNRSQPKSIATRRP